MTARPSPRTGRTRRVRPDAPQGGRALRAGQGQLRRRRHGCPACCTARCCAARTPTPASSPSTRRPPRRTRRSRRSSPARRSRRLNLAWMPTLSYDVQAVLATDKVRYQGQEVAFVIAEDHYSARDALELIDVEYEPLPAVDRRPQRARPGRAGHPRRPGGPDRQPHLRLGVRRQGEDATRCSPTPRSSSTQDMLYPRVHPAPLETCGAVADMDQVTGKLTVWTTTQAPHAHRTVYALVAGLPEHKIRIISPDIGGGFGSKVGIYPGYVLAIVGSIVTGKPVKWVEDRSENLMTHRVRPRLPHARRDRGDEGRQDPRPAGRRARRPRRVQRHRAADQVPGRLLPHLHRLATTCRPRTARSPASTRTRRRAGSRTPARSASPRPSTSSSGWSTCSPTSWAGPGRAADEEPAPARAVPVHHADRLGVRLRRLPAGAAAGAWTWPATTSCARSRPRSAPRGELMGIGVASSPRASAPARASTWTSSASAWPTAPSCGSTRPARRCCASRVQTQGQGHETTFAQIVAQRARHPARGHRGRPRRHRQTRRSGWAPTAPAPRRSPARRPRSWPARCATRRRSSPPRCSRCSPDDLEWEQRPLVRQGRPGAGQDDPGDRPARPRQPGAARGRRGPPGRDAPSTTRRTSPTRSAPTSASSTSTRAPAQVKVRRFIAVDDCGPRINPMIVEGQVHGGLADGVGMALMQVIAFDEDGNHLGGVVHGLPAADLDGVPVVGAGRDGHAVAAPPDRRQGRRRVRHGRLAARGGQRGARRAQAVRRPPRRHAADARPRCGGRCRAARSGPDLAIQ